jgi:hypothetical protein
VLGYLFFRACGLLMALFTVQLPPDLSWKSGALSILQLFIFIYSMYISTDVFLMGVRTYLGHIVGLKVNLIHLNCCPTLDMCKSSLSSDHVTIVEL